MKYRTIIIGLSSCLILSSCIAPRGQMGMPRGGGGHGGGGNAGALITLGVGVVIGTIIATLPDKHTAVGHERYYSEGVFYRDSPNGYEVISAPVGVWVDQIPDKHIMVRYPNREYFKCKGTWYIFDPSIKRYQVVAAPTEFNLIEQAP